jgi:peptidoglycan/LPS O-acetylase OafA/YrhL
MQPVRLEDHMAQLEAQHQALVRPILEQPAALDAPRRIRLESIDALRALAAIAVVLVHSFEIYGLGLPDIGNPTGGLTDTPSHQLIFALYDWLFRLGGLAVPIFIVLSGYSLMIPVARSSQSLTTFGQLRTFFFRRAKRIVPPYYAAMLLSLLVIALVPGMNAAAGVYWDRALRDLDAVNIAAHLVLVHNVSDSWRDSINPPMWSMAVEWQIYFLFPLFVLLWRRIGGLVVLGVAAVYGIAPMYLPITVLPFSHTHFVLLFALGMAGAMINFAEAGLEARLRTALPWGLLALLGLLVFTAMHVGSQLGLPLPDGWMPEIVVGAAVMALVVHCTRSQLDGRPSAVERALSHRALVSIGAFSYSLYLVHLPILALLALLARTMAIPTTAAYLLVFAAGLPLSLVVSYAFHLAFERPFLNTPSSDRAPKAAAATR